ncbi:glycosyltransferase family 4 protein [Salirhabdus salicampi]|uniref:glycosyltransferase family 4 protein n=1 Tax=Salirhabdus salicampi TaxID=476102 RepID=UPI0020C2E687|nr:MraY family glycosyltransferase [Salirhabdus salicampi]MCP8617475.1 undecaprenyl/decaprenyl-phosphate alpha-N-acetylglucosaminyl 1-phosphate transferase [Salirhabdus salicampi]
MISVFHLIIAFFISLITSLLITYPVMTLARKIGALDQPNERKVHEKVTPRLGGLGMFSGVIAGLLYLQPNHPEIMAIALGSLIIVLTGVLDDKYELRPVTKLLGQLTAALVLVLSGLVIEVITVPFFGMVSLGYLSIPITILWIVGVTNAINLIDGLDGLASGVSTIAISSILVMAIIDSRLLVVYLCVVLIGSNIGFLFHNFHPAKIYMGDTGSLFLGYSIAVISMLGLFKNLALFSFIIPMIVLAVPILDTTFAIVRRIYNKESIMRPDKKHIHYQLLAAGFSHRATVLIIYCFSTIFGILAILFLNGSTTTYYVIMFFSLFLIQLFAEIVSPGGRKRKPLLTLLNKVIPLDKVIQKL